jgi:hypothetical protein
MGRKKVSRKLPPLRGIARNNDRGDRTADLVKILREIAIKNQTDQPQTFYSMRDIASGLQVPLSTVPSACRQLEREDLLTRIRGSKTILKGAQFDRRLTVRAFVGLPACLSSFLTIQDYRTFFMSIRKELRLHDFASAMPLFKRDELRGITISERFKSYEVDTVIWLSPPRASRESLARLIDMGIRIIIISQGERLPMPARYQIRRDDAIRKLLGHWRSAYHVGEVTVVQSPSLRCPATEDALTGVAEELGIQCSTISFNGEPIEEFVGRLQQVGTGGILFPSSGLVSFFCFRSPNALGHLLQSRRVGFIDGPVNIPFAPVPDVQVDLVTVDWQSVAKRIVADLISQEAFCDLSSRIFEAKAQLRVPLNRFAESI